MEALDLITDPTYKLVYLESTLTLGCNEKKNYLGWREHMETHCKDKLDN